MKRKSAPQSHFLPGRGFKPTINIPHALEIYWKGASGGLTADAVRLIGNNLLSQHIVNIPSHISFNTTAENTGRRFIFKSARGSVQALIPAHFPCSVHQRVVRFSPVPLHRRAEFKTLVGALYRMLLGVTKGYKGKLKTVGVGYKGELTKKRLAKMALGYSHPVYYPIHASVALRFSRKNNRFNLSGSNPRIISQAAADLYSFRRPDVYRGKGVRYRGFKLLKKEGKKKK